jgi:hypothetical protein
VRLKPWLHLDRFRIVVGKMRSPLGEDYGSFAIPNALGQTLVVIASNADPMHNVHWEHVSVSLRNRCPNWPEMSLIKALFWNDDETVVQYHPPRAEYVSYHPHCLHLWLPVGIEIPRPPAWMVGPRKGQSNEDAIRESEIAMGVSQ